ncbi:MAG: hypothetical protein A3J63_02600 [Candidatus Moranbacteria bacterium RIFCSPHIGHO2_02_FULL_40_12b]|nr:MAG: hypothetical protein A3J63_02600 [Candidatus Moranbacteria bacterium RIFCSPHIGHO2_02_FULL_40_12b]OGI24070.1 MAG: hypothetical protein A3E91_00250 [Candidatus Moranbacteria bacterium RIFCSPHIGHO2_12_FULL_40_10]
MEEDKIKNESEEIGKVYEEYVEKVEKLRSEENSIIDELEEKMEEIKNVEIEKLRENEEKLGEVKNDFQKALDGLKAEYNVIASARQRNKVLTHPEQASMVQKKEKKAELKKEKKKENIYLKSEKSETQDMEKLVEKKPAIEPGPSDDFNSPSDKPEEEKMTEVVQENVDNETSGFPKPEPITEKLIREEPVDETASPQITQDNSANIATEPEPPKMTFESPKENYEPRILEIKTREDLINLLDSIPGIQDKEKFFTSDELKKAAIEALDSRNKKLLDNITRKNNLRLKVYEIMRHEEK